MGNALSSWIAELGLWPLIVVLVPNLMFRKYRKAAERKRMASLFQAIAVFAVTTLASFLVDRNLGDQYLYMGMAATAAVLVILRKKIFPYRLTCPQCSSRLDFRTIYFLDNHLCADCRAAENNEDEQPTP